jgi:O-antigen ligase
MKLFGQSPLIGYGPSYWVRDELGVRTGSPGSRFALGANYSTHNVFLEMLVSVGALGTIAFVLSLILASVSSRRRNFTIGAYTTALIGVFAGLSFTEVASAPGRIYLFPGVLIYLFLAANAGNIRSDGRYMPNEPEGRGLSYQRSADYSTMTTPPMRTGTPNRHQRRLMPGKAGPTPTELP